jgi:DNA-binding MurR/RpiR family transcriptional regulator
LSQKSSIFERIRTADLTSEQARVAEHMTGNLHRTAFLSGPELAKECQTSIAATTRLAQKLGYDGFPQLKQALEEEYRRSTTPLEMFQSYLSEHDTVRAEIVSVQQDLANVQSMMNNFDKVAFNKVVRLLAKASQIKLGAIASAEILVDYFTRFLEALKKPPVCLKSFGITRLAEVLPWGKSEVLVLFSFQRIIEEVCELADFARAKGVTTVGITDSPTNPLAKAVDYVLVTPVVGTTFGLSLTCPLTMINMIVNAMVVEDKDSSLKALKEVKAAWEKYPIFTTRS